LKSAEPISVPVENKVIRGGRQRKQNTLNLKLELAQLTNAQRLSISEELQVAAAEESVCHWCFLYQPQHPALVIALSKIPNLRLRFAALAQTHLSLIERFSFDLQSRPVGVA